MNETLLQDLIQYKNHKDKSWFFWRGGRGRCFFFGVSNSLASPAGVTVAARSLLALYREVNPSLLHKRDRVSHACFALMRQPPSPGSPFRVRCWMVQGKPGEHHDADVKAAEYAELRPASFVPGTELLSMLEDAAAEGGEGGAAADVAAAVEEEMAGWETASDESDDDEFVPFLFPPCFFLEGARRCASFSCLRFAVHPQ